MLFALSNDVNYFITEKYFIGKKNMTIRYKAKHFFTDCKKMTSISEATALLQGSQGLK